jgi:hypothetical protein
MIIDWTDITDINIQPYTGCEAYEIGKILGVLSQSLDQLKNIEDWYYFLGYRQNRRKNVKS